MKKEKIVVPQEEEETKPMSLTKSIMNALAEGSVERLSFESSPDNVNTYAGIYKQKTRLVPDAICKRIAIQDSLVSNIVRARQNHMSMFGRPRPDRHSFGFIIKANTGVIDGFDDDQKKKFNEQVERAVKLLTTCGHTDYLADRQKITFSQFLSESARSAVVNGRIATEIVWAIGEDGEKKFSHFCVVDGGTIYYAAHHDHAQEAVRRNAYNLLCNVTGKKLEKEKFVNDEYAWVQVVDGRPVQVFTSDELKCYNFYPAPDVELDGYPVTPIDTVVSAITTHLNIVTHSKLYFQNGRASRGMLLFKSDDITPKSIAAIKQQFNASINNVNNSWRMPVFGCGANDDITWQPLDTGGTKDMEFQYLCDLNAREILTAFMMSPDELPGWSYLSRGTNNQALSESNNEYKLSAARDVGIRPLVLGFEDFINTEIFPLIAPELSKISRIQLVGLESENPEKEAVRIQQDMGLWETYDGILSRVERSPVGEKWGGALPLNPTIKSYLDQYFTVGEILAKFCDRPEAAKDPALAYRRDPFFFQWHQLMMQQQMQQEQMQQQQMQMQQQEQGQQQGGQQGQQDQPHVGGQNNPEKTERQKTDAQEEASAGELARSLDLAMEEFSKSESQLPHEQKIALAQQRATVKFFMRGWLEDVDATVQEILKAAKKA